MLMSSSLGRTFLFLADLAWKNRVALPALIMMGCMVFNYRGEIEINIHTGRIALHDLPNRQQDGGAFGAIAIDLDDYSDEEEEYEDDDLLEYYDSEDDDEYDDDDDDLYSSSYDEEDEYDEDVNEGDQEEGDTLNGTIRLHRFATVNIHVART
uniref:Uncharacterized protein n=1 Tax=Anopheles farauti TaxID=69004 RepID=A0A182QEX0_9DIPT